MAVSIDELNPICHDGKSGVKTLAVSAKFYANNKDDELPFRESNLSRLEASVIDGKGPASNVLTFNIPAWEINELWLKTRVAVQMLMLNEMPCGSASTGGDGTASSLAFSVSLMLNAFKGKTPGAVLAADPSQKGALLSGREWLASNLAKYPANQKQIDAIDEAFKLLEENKLTETANTDKPSIGAKVLSIYKRDYKYKSKKDSAGNNLVYSVNITCDPSRNMPFTIEVMNCYAPVISSGGHPIVKTASATNIKRVSMSLSDSEWIGITAQAYDLYKNFKLLNAPRAFDRVAKNSYSPN